ncbi:MAG: hypothetical protein KA223_04870 [Candidatus Accumulibacter sp.]|nr:hypothetical protein [Accumulibacter sp.]
MMLLLFFPGLAALVATICARGHHDSCLEPSVGLLLPELGSPLVTALRGEQHIAVGEVGSSAYLLLDARPPAAIAAGERAGVP